MRVFLSRQANAGRMILIALAATVFVTVAVGCATTAPAARAAYQVELTTDPTPPRSGQATTLRAQVTDETGTPVDGAKVTIEREHTGMAHERATTDATAAESGAYTARANFSMSGTWNVKVTAEGPRGRAEKNFQVAVQ